MTHLQETTNGYSLYKMKLTNLPNANSISLSDILQKSLIRNQLLSLWNDKDMQLKFASTISMFWPTLHWFHAILGHPGTNCMHATLKSIHPIPTCKCILDDNCVTIINAKIHWTLPWLTSNQNIACAWWAEVTVDFIGPWPASIPHNDIQFFALTCINTTTNLVELAKIVKNLAITLLIVLSMPDSPSTQNQWNSSMIMRENSLVLPANTFYRCWTESWFWLQEKILSQMPVTSKCIRLLYLCWKHCFPNHLIYAAK